MSAAQEATLKPISSWLVFAVCAATQLVFWYLCTHVWYGAAPAYLLLPMLIVLSAALIPVMMSAWWELNAKPAFAALALACAIVAFSTSIHVNFQVSDANETLAHAAANLGHPAQIAPRFNSMTKDVATAQANLATVKEIALATTRPDEVTNFLAAAGQFGLDARFVAQNGMIRKRDRQALYRRAIELSAGGNAQAASFVANGAALASR